MNTKKPLTLASQLVLTKVPQEQVEEMLSEVGKVLVESITLRALPMLTPSERAQFDDLLSEGAESDAVYSFLAERVPDLPAIADEEAALMMQLISTPIPGSAEPKKRAASARS